METLAYLQTLLSPERQSNRWKRGLAARPPVYFCKIQAVCRICVTNGTRSKRKKTLHKSDLAAGDTKIRSVMQLCAGFGGISNHRILLMWYVSVEVELPLSRPVLISKGSKH
jgi:hypothetical protein